MGEFRISGRWYFHRDDIRDARASDTRLYGRYMENARSSGLLTEAISHPYDICPGKRF